MGVPLVLAGATHLCSSRSTVGRQAASAPGLLPVPATALVLFVVVAAVLPQLVSATSSALAALPFYVAFACLAPIVGWLLGAALGLQPPAGRAVAFSAGTRNSLVVLPLALAAPAALPVLPAIIVTQTLVELLAELVYVRWIPRFGANRARAGSGGS